MMATSSFTSARCDRNKIHGDILYEALADLTHDDFKRFKDRLSDFSDGGRGSIPRGRLETADYVTAKNVLIDVYGKEAALDVTIQVFKLINLMGPAEALQHQLTQDVKPQKMSTNVTLEGWVTRRRAARLLIRQMGDPAAGGGCRVRYMDQMRRKYHLIKHHDKRLGKGLNLKKDYTSLLLIKNHRDEKERLHEITASGQRHLQIMEDRSYSSITIPALFDPDDDDGIIPKTVVLQGPAGIGKTMTSQKIMLDWASGDLYKGKFNFVFYISCREVNTITGNISLAGYLSSYFGRTCSSDLLQSIFLTSEEILFIIDGLDELKWSSINDTKVCDDPFQEVSKENLLKSLIKKTLLSDSSLIITTRPFSLMKLVDLAECHRYVDILGFTGKEREEYFYHFFETKEEADLAFSTTKENDTLFTMCAVPITCWIVCMVMKPLLKEELSVIDSKTVTSIYLFYLKGLIQYHGRDSAQHISTCIQKLCALANEGVWDQRIIFEESDLVRHGLSVSEVESGFLNENIFHRDLDTRTCYSFIHLSVQEFFAALYYVLDDISVKEHCTDFSKVKDLLEASEDQPHIKLTVRFLFGLSSNKQIQETQKTIGCPISFNEKPVLEEWLKRKSPIDHKEILICLYETQDEDLVGRMLSHFLKIGINGPHSQKGNLENIGYRAVAYCLERSTVQHIVLIQYYIIGPKARRVLSKALSKCSKLCFRGCRFPVTEDVTQAGASLSGLFGQCQMEELVLQHCALTSSCCDDLRSVLTTNRSLTRLDLIGNYLRNTGIKLLCEGLRHSACTLQDLRLFTCDLTSSCCDDLRSVITTNRSLTTLDLSWNVLEDSGIKLLCEGLRHPACTLQDLWPQKLMGGQGGEASPGVDREQGNQLCDVELLGQWNFVKPPVYTGRSPMGGWIPLERRMKEIPRHQGPVETQVILTWWKQWMFQSCLLLKAGSQEKLDQKVYLPMLEKETQFLIISECGDSGEISRVKAYMKEFHYSCLVSLILERDYGKYPLPDPYQSCKMLERCYLTSSCCDDLRSVITTNRSLTSLNLDRNTLGDLGIKLLCEGLRHPACALQHLRLQFCRLTSSCCDDLHSVLTTNRSLTRLDVSNNDLEDSRIKLRECVRPPLQLLV
ncbi:NACHT, LRR and PYD domains-containing protein 3-like [Pseudophryne corroboree]|uniref:NACHT, LRR and PYD domains-containing protein 3-like n=1 Tax=Pseudophryne corroboree TaxID=495146 RepID=UPI003082004E